MARRRQGLLRAGHDLDEVAVKIGDMCAIWTGAGSCHDRSNWILGVVTTKSDVKNSKYALYRVLWATGEVDPTWYSSDDIELERDFLR